MKKILITTESTSIQRYIIRLMRHEEIKVLTTPAENKFIQQKMQGRRRVY